MRLRTFLSVLLVAVILAASAVVAVVLHNGATARARDAEQDSARQAAQELEKTLQATGFRLRGVVGLFEASEEVTAPEFRAFAAPLFGEQRALNAVVWLPRVTDDRRQAFERAVAPITEGPPDARHRAGKRGVYFPAAFVESKSPVRAPGFDGASDPVRLAAIRRAIVSSQAQATDPVTLAGAGKPGILLYQPVFGDHAVPRTGAERHAAVKGVIAGSYRLDKLFASLRRTVPAGTELQIRQDGTLIGGAAPEDGGESSRVSVVGRSWSVKATSGKSPSLAVPAAVLLAGAALALLVALMLRQASTRERYALTMVAARMSERDAAQHELEAARTSAQALAAEQSALRNIATHIAAEAPLRTVSDTIRTELAQIFGAQDAAVLMRDGLGRTITGSEPDWLLATDDPSIVRSEIRVAGVPRGAVALLNPGDHSHEGIGGRLPDFAELASVAILAAEAREELAHRASTDGLTGLMNRRTFDECLEGEVALAVRDGRPLALAIIDIDHFKRINDRHGHLAGDSVLTDVAGRLRDLARGDDIVARIGGEEFAWIMPETKIPVAFDIADRVRAAVATIIHDDASDLTVSVGISALGDAVTGDALYALADNALFQAKRDGRNRTIRHDPAHQLTAAGSES